MTDIKKVLTATDRATKAIIKATTDLNTVTSNLGICVKTNEALTTEIEFKQSELSQLENQSEVKLRTLNAELGLRVLENEDKVLNEILRKRKLAHITLTEVEGIEYDLANAKKGNADAISEAVQSACATLHSKYGADKKGLEATHLVAVAQKDADNKSLTDKVAFMQQTIDGLQDTIKAERDARIQMAESASKASGVVVNTSAK